MIQLVTIDFDDTLSQTEEATFFLENETAEEMGFPPMSRESHRINWGKPLEEAIVERIPGIDPKEFMKLFEKNLERYIKEGKMDTIPDVNLEFLDKLHESERKLAILTSRSLSEVKHLLEKEHPLINRIERFYHKDNSQFLKPDPRVFDAVLNDFSVTPQETVYVGDSIGDGVSAKAAGLHFIAVLESGIRTVDDFKDIPVDYFATTLPEALEYILAA